jgi:hypothetical protein
MHTRRWMLVIAVVGCLTAGAALGEPSQQPQPKQPQAPQAVQDTKPPLAQDAVKSVQMVDPLAYERPCKPGHDDRNSDLCAQWKAADASAAAAKWAQISAYTGGIAAILLLVTLIYTGKATRAADRAAQAAHAACKIATDSSQAQLRAYVNVMSVRITDVMPGCFPKAEVTFQNNGVTPAKQYGHWIGLLIDDHPTFYDFSDESLNAINGKSVLAPNAVSHAYCQVAEPLTPEQYDLIMSGKAAIWIFGRAVYQDVFGGDRFLTYRHIFGGDVERHPKGLTSPCKEGNDAT